MYVKHKMSVGHKMYVGHKIIKCFIIFVWHICPSDRHLYSSAGSARRNARRSLPKATDNAVRVPTKLEFADKF